MAIEIITNSPAETIEVGKYIGQQLQGGEVVSLIGNLGTGKTHLIKGIANGVCEDDNEQHEVNSPTFVLINEYLNGRLDLYHIDAYRLDSVREFENLGFDDLCYEDSVVLIEWADKVMEAIKNIDLLDIRLYHEGENQRKIVIENPPEYLKV